MKLIVKNIKEIDSTADAVILPIIKELGVKPYEQIDLSINHVASKAISSKEFNAEPNEVLLVHTLGALKPVRVLFIGLGEKDKLTKEKLRQAGGKAATYLRDAGCKEIAISTYNIDKYTADFVEGALLSQYKFGRYKKEENPKDINTLTILTSEDIEDKLKWVEAISNAVSFAKDLVNAPSNDMTPAKLASSAMSLEGKGVSVKILEKRDVEKLGMGAYLSVSKGSMEPLKFIVITYKAKNTDPIVLVGKSITFDSGGISIKPSEGMEKMKYDMAGGAAVLGVIKAIASAKLPLHVVGILPATENLPSGTASKPGDVVKAIGGMTIEIINTDAEGRLALADAIGYAKRFKPKAIIDIATLTGACTVALGNEAIAMMGNDQALMDKIKTASAQTYERVWQMPLFDEYKEYIKSDIADLKNSSGRGGSLVTAGYFLKEFAGDTPWVHLDIASTAWEEKGRPYIPKGATGIGVRLMLEFLRSL